MNSTERLWSSCLRDGLLLASHNCHLDEVKERSVTDRENKAITT